MWNPLSPSAWLVTLFLSMNHASTCAPATSTVPPKYSFT
jgi:hypothetical protein